MLTSEAGRHSAGATPTNGVPRSGSEFSLLAFALGTSISLTDSPSCREIKEQQWANMVRNCNISAADAAIVAYKNLTGTYL